MEVNSQRPRVGVAVMILKEDKILLGMRKGSHGEGQYAFPGGHLEYMESYEECARRETREETGLEIKHIRFLCLFNMKRYAPKHYVHIGLCANWERGEPSVLESDRCVSWGWYDIDRLPSPLFDGVRESIEAYQTGKNFYDA